MKMFNFSNRSKLLISTFTIATAISTTAVTAEMNPAMEKPMAETSEMKPSMEKPTAETPEMKPAMEKPTAETPEMNPAMEKPTAETSPMAANEGQQTIAEIASSSDSFKTLTAALEAADLVTVLGGEGSFTVFAPTDKAFAALPEGTLEELLKPENKETLVQVLTYHVIPKTIMSSDLTAGEVTTVEGSTVTIGLEDKVKVNEAEVLQTDIKASNGVIHVIDKVIIPAE